MLFPKFNLPNLQKLQITLGRLRSLSHWQSISSLPINIAYQNYNCIFIHIPKTAGLSVSNSLFGCNSIHSSYLNYRYIFGNHYVDNAFTFTFVRNPLDRFISASKFLLSGGISKQDEIFRSRFLFGCETLDDIVNILKSHKAARTYYHFLPQVSWLFDYNDEINLDFVGKIENLSSDFAKVSSILNYRYSDLQSLNKNKLCKDTFFVSKYVVNWVHDYYSEDYSMLDYSK